MATGVGAPHRVRVSAAARGCLRLPHDGIALNERFGGNGAVIYKHARALGCEGIASKRLAIRTTQARSTIDSRSKSSNARSEAIGGRGLGCYAARSVICPARSAFHLLFSAARFAIHRNMTAHLAIFRTFFPLQEGVLHLQRRTLTCP